MESNTNFEDEPLAPIEVSLSQAYLVESDYILKVEITAKDKLRTSEVLLSLHGLDEGTLQEEQLVRLSDFLQEEFLEVEDRILVPFKLDSNNLTEFQIHVFWGKEALDIINQKILNNDISDLEEDSIFALKENENDIEINSKNETETEYEDIEPDSSLSIPLTRHPDLPNKESLIKQDQEIDQNQDSLAVVDFEINEEIIDCPEPSCPKKLTLRGKIKNPSEDYGMEKIRLAFGLFFVPDGSVPKTPFSGSKLKPGEEELNFKGAMLKPLNKLEFEIKIDRPVYDISGGRLVPYVRVLTYETYSEF